PLSPPRPLSLPPRPPPPPPPFPYTTLFRSPTAAAPSPCCAASVHHSAPRSSPTSSRRRCSVAWAHSRAHWPASPSSSPCRCCSRSEEHTSELQSRENLVCRLLLEKKKDKNQ